MDVFNLTLESDLTKPAMEASKSTAGTPSGGLRAIQNGFAPSKACEPLLVPIAIVGMASKFSGDASSPSKLWELCASGGDGWSRIPADRFNVESLYHPEKEKVGRVSIKNYFASYAYNMLTKSTESCHRRLFHQRRHSKL